MFLRAPEESFCWLSYAQGTGDWPLETGYLTPPSDTCPRSPCSSTLGAKSTKMLGGADCFLAKPGTYAPLRLSASLFPSASPECACRQGGGVMLQRSCLLQPNPCGWQWCSRCFTSQMEPFSQVITIPNPRNKLVSRTPSRNQEIIISLLCSHTK